MNNLAPQSYAGEFLRYAPRNFHTLLRLDDDNDYDRLAGIYIQLINGLSYCTETEHIKNRLCNAHLKALQSLFSFLAIQSFYSIL